MAFVNVPGIRGRGNPYFAARHPLPSSVAQRPFEGISLFFPRPATRDIPIQTRFLIRPQLLTRI